MSVKKRKKKNIRFILILAAILVVLGTIVAVQTVEREHNVSETAAPSDMIEPGTGEVVLDGKKYQYNDHLSNFLFLGIDNRQKEATKSGQANAGQADALYLLSWDRVKDEITVIAIPVSYTHLDVYKRQVGGLGMFIYGMQIMAQGLENAAGSKMKTMLEALTKNKFFGVLLGALITAVIQSSSATTVMVVGFVNAGIMNLAQAMGVIMGANIGTTVTGWLVSSVEWAKFLRPSNLAPIAVMAGVIVMLMGKRRSTKDISSIIIGFGLLFIGITTMSSAVSPLQESEGFRSLFVTLGHNPFLGILAGALVTAVIQSSSASVGILQSLAAAGLVPFNAAVYIIMGQNIGTCVTAIMSSIGAKKTAKTAAIMHLVFNICLLYTSRCV